ncbi:MAG TPA: hypothetical protein DCL60_02660, partial [Armatimonadetes bacterium]|nr:hypothetical protein [Armatimonadota bacterium]
MAKSYKETLLTEASRIPEKASITICRDVISRPEQGIGINITLDKQAEGIYPKDKDGWQQILEYLSWLSPAWLCITLPVGKIIKSDGSLNKESDILTQFDYFCRWAEANGADIALMFPKSVPAWLQFKGLPCHSSAPADLQAYADLICNALDHFVHTRRYTRIKYLTIFGEPFNEDGEDFTFSTPEGTDPYLYYVEMHRVVREALDKTGLGSVGLMGPNSADVYAFLETDRNMKERKADLLPYITAVDLHSYRMRFDYLPPSRHID